MAELFSMIPEWLIPSMILLISITAVAIILERAWYLYRSPGPLPPEAQLEFAQLLSRDRGAAVRYAQAESHPVMQELAATLEQEVRSNGSFKRAVDRAAAAYRRFLPTLGLISTVAPLLGLLGTVTGMIRSFRALAATGAENAALLGGIDEALITTALGLFTAIPALVAYNYYAARANEIMESIEELFRRAEDT